MGFLGDTLILLQYDLFRTGSRLPGHLDFAGSELHLLVFVISSEPQGLSCWCFPRWDRDSRIKCLKFCLK